MLMRHDAIQNDLKQLGLLGAISVIDSGLGHLLEEDGCKGDLLFKGQGRAGIGAVLDPSGGRCGGGLAQRLSRHSALKRGARPRDRRLFQVDRPAPEALMARPQGTKKPACLGTPVHENL